MEYCEIIADNLSKAGWSWGLHSQPWILTGEQSSSLTRNRGDGKRFIVRVDEKLSAFLELEAAIRGRGFCIDKLADFFQTSRQ